jgi:DNA-binding beta-propeller fold protein YncE
MGEEGNTFSPPLEKEIRDSALRLAVSAARNHVLVVHGVLHTLCVLDGDTGEFQSEIVFPVGEVPADLVVDDDASAVYLAIATPPTPPPQVTKVVKLMPKDAKSYTIEWTTSIKPMVSTVPRLTLDPKRGRVYVTSNRAPAEGGPEDPGVTILNSANGAVIDVVRPEEGRG